MSDTTRIAFERSGHIAIVRLNRPEKMNALDMQTFNEILQIQQEIASDPKIRAVVLTATGDNFCAGLDIQGVMTDPNAVETLLSQPEDYQLASAKALGNYVQQVVVGWQQLKVPVIAALNGYVFGGGLQIALGADFRIAHPESQLSVMEIRWGIIPDMGISVVAPSVIARDQLKLMAMTGDRVSGEKALQLGLVTETEDNPEEKARELANTLSLRNPQAVQGIKHLFNTDNLSPSESLALEEKLQRGILFSPNQIEAVQANLQKRDPEFK
ncbi:crotonase/enoyl-CoA hydratase family protein [Oceanospirillum linum]|uniref:Enoyl-CoA hydratase n=1 Tax=Oceanospirillum linum TaxID=966 RepID=A0A1T1HEI8_OCELI|nr:crotonase/enoyl-CoA hydratase family protein [Oceanospirillum linum]OOV88137.1 hypothetical protein BTA35_0200880 [Oceanospirillum linum]SEF44424.1 Enoyl-CoA hydratase/carnithine racemase [Oleiphilus messinensis]SMP01581.1 Enoyl-CoA hydratase/carnithine racemase [Oceanospirillum linum]